MPNAPASIYDRFLEKLITHADNFQETFWSCDDVRDEKAVSAAISRFYRRMKLDAPCVLWCDNPQQLAVWPSLLQLLCLLFCDRPQEFSEHFQHWLQSNSSPAKELEAKFVHPMWQQIYHSLTDELMRVCNQSASEFRPNPDLLIWLDMSAKPYPHLLKISACGTIGLPDYRFGHSPQDIWNSAWQKMDQAEAASNPARTLVETQINRDMGVGAFDDFVPNRHFSRLRNERHKLKGLQLEKAFGDYLSVLTDYSLTWGHWSRCNRTIPIDILEKLSSGELADELRDFVLVRDGAFMYVFTQGFVFACRHPLALRKDASLRLHSYEQPAIEFPDGYGIYSWHGVLVPRHLVEAPKMLTVQYIETTSNVELRRVLIDRYGTSKYLIDAGATIVDEDDRGILYRLNIPQDEAMVMVQVTNTTPEPDSTYKRYFLRVPPNITSAQEAVAWSFALESNSYHPEVET